MFLAKRLGSGAACDCRNNREGLAVSHVGRHAVHEADVIIGDEDVHETSEVAIIVQEPLGKTGVGRLQRAKHSLDRARLDFDRGLAGGERAQGGWDSNRDCHSRDSSRHRPKAHMHVPPFLTASRAVTRRAEPSEIRERCGYGQLV